MAQGEEWNKEEIVEMLRPYFELGYNVRKACMLAQFPRSTFATWLKDDKELRQKVKAWRNMMCSVARRNIVNKIDEGDTNLSKWWLEKRESKEWSDKQEIDITSKGEKIGYELTDDQIRKVLERKQRKEAARRTDDGEVGEGSDGGTIDDGTSAT